MINFLLVAKHSEGIIVNMFYQVRRTALMAATADLGVAWSVSAFADTGALRVMVTDADGNAIAGASVNASTPESLTSKVPQSGKNPADLCFEDRLAQPQSPDVLRQ